MPCDWNVATASLSSGILCAPAGTGASEITIPKIAKAQIAALHSQVAALKSSNSGLQAQVAAIQANPVLTLGPFVEFDPKPENGVIGPNITLKGAKPPVAMQARNSETWRAAFISTL